MLVGQVIVKMVVAGRAAKNTRFFLGQRGAWVAAEARIKARSEKNENENPQG